ncbi:MAG: hypothetical protein Q9M29_07945 [Mariprofundaceae bacterium]|nr:hypothetical protein [Mariprofundaceae bacterium]
MDGYALATYIRRRSPFQRIIVISAMADTANEANSELCYTLHKPFTRESVMSLVHGHGCLRKILYGRHPLLCT